MNKFKIQHQPNGETTLTLNGEKIPDGFTYRIRTGKDGKSIVTLMLAADRLTVEGETYGRDVDALRRKCGCGE